MNIKICGVKTIDIAREVVESGASHIGFVFFKRSPRNLTPAKAAEIVQQIKGAIKTVVVTVNPTDELLNEITSLFKPDFIQLHGSETLKRVKEIKQKFGIKIIKAITIHDKDDLEKAAEFKEVAEYILFDAKPNIIDALPGGNAISFNWNLLKDFSPDYKWILSGGLNHRNVKDAIKLTGANFVDVSSGVESIPGSKDVSLIRAFIRACHH